MYVNICRSLSASLALRLAIISLIIGRGEGMHIKSYSTKVDYKRPSKSMECE